MLYIIRNKTTGENMPMNFLINILATALKSWFSKETPSIHAAVDALYLVAVEVPMENNGMRHNV